MTLKVRVGSLLPGRMFRTLLTNRLGVVAHSAFGRWGEVMVDFEDQVAAMLHRDVVVELIK